MKQARKLILGCMLAVFGTSAHAILVDFQDLADNVMGEQGLSTLSIFGMDITGWDGSTAAYAYLDDSNAGLGVCKNINDPGDLHCKPGSDDNVDTVGEFIRITFTRNLVVEDLFLNSNHDSPRHLDGGSIDFSTDIGGSVSSSTNVFSFADECANNGTTAITDADCGNGSTGDRDFLYTLDTEFEVGDTLEIAYNDVQFYLGKITYNTPEPLSLALMGFGLIGVSALRRRRLSA